MAGDKKDDKKPPSGPLISVEDATYTLIGIVVLLLILSRLIDVLSTIRIAEGVGTHPIFGSIKSFWTNFVLPFIRLFALVVSVFAFAGIYWSTYQAGKIAEAYKAMFDPVIPGNGSSQEDVQKNKRWERVLQHLNSENQNDWKFAIIEADIMLSDLLDRIGYRGETVADKLKKVEPSDFLTIEMAWEAHKVRNMVAHQGTDYFISEREARRVIGLYQKVFEEFHFI